MANNGELKEDNTVLETLGDSPELIFVFGLLFQSPSREDTHSARRQLVVSFRIVSND